MDNNWPIVEFGEFTKLVKRPTESSGVIRSVGVKWYGAGVHVVEEKTVFEFRAARFDIYKDDLIYNDMWARKGSVAIVPEKFDGCVASAHFPTWELDKSTIYPPFLAWYFRTPQFWDMCENSSQGSTGRNAISKKGFRKLTVPLPPLDEQCRVVARIEELAAKVEQAERLRRQAVGEVEALKIAALKKVRVSLLQDVIEKKRIGQITTVTSGGTPSRRNPTFWDDGSVPWVKTGELLDRDIYDAEEHITSEGLRNSSAKLFPPGTILIALYGQGQTRGRTGRLMIEAATNQACCAILPTENLEPRFTQYWLQSLYSEMREKARGGAQPNWNGRMIKNVQIAIPALSEQRQVVAYLDSLQAKIEAVKRCQAATAARLEALLPSILDKAFKGEL